MIRKLITSFLATILFSSLYGQTTTGLVAHYSFENCDATDVSLNNSDGILFGDPACECGVRDQALYFDGVDDYMVLAGNVETYFQDRVFTLSMYFRTDDSFGTHDVLSKRAKCDYDKAYAIRYTPSSRTLSVDIAQSDEVRTSFFLKLDPGSCWIHLVVMKGPRNHSIYVNAELVATMPVDGTMDITSPAALQIGNGSCIGSTDRRFNGYVDEIRVYNKTLSQEDVESLYYAPDRIITRDTSIYQGGTAILKSGPTCAPSVAWSPSALVDPTDELSTIATPPETETFTLSYLYPTCTATDTVRVEVINPEEIECGKVPIPSAFTPNNDGRNDEFFISNPFALEVLNAFEIFDRWGNVVFTTTEVSDRWDGRFRGKEVNPGLYLYKIKYRCRGEDLVKSGSIMLLR